VVDESDGNVEMSCGGRDGTQRGRCRRKKRKKCSGGVEVRWRRCVEVVKWCCGGDVLM
jgi:hypothetical protein